MKLNSFREDWFSNVRGDVLAGLVVALALIPEALAHVATLAMSALRLVQGGCSVDGN